jgi:ABC-type transport system substrate-binding protein
MYEPFVIIGTERIAAEGIAVLSPGVFSEWAWSDDFKTLSLQFSEGIMPHDPQYGEFTSADFEWIINTYQPWTQGPSGLLLQDQGIKAHPTGKYSADLKKDDGTRHTLNLLNYEMARAILAGPIRNQIEAIGYDRGNTEALGYGPFRPVSQPPDVKIYERVPDHYRLDPAMDTLKIIKIGDSSTAVALVMGGQADAAIAVDEPDAFRAEDNGHPLHITPGAWRWHIYFGGMTHPTIVGDAPWVGDTDSALKIRQAIALSVDVEALCEELHRGYCDRLVTMYPAPISPSYEPYEYNPTKAKQLLDEAGWDYDYTIDWPVVVSGAGDRRGGPEHDAIAIMLQNVGFKINDIAMEGGSAFYPGWNSGSLTTHIFVFPRTAQVGADTLAWHRNVAGAFSYYSWPTVREDCYDPLVALEGIDVAAYNALDKECNDRIYDGYNLIPIYTTNEFAVLGKDFVEWRSHGFMQQSLRFDGLVFKP